jgi:hypothetical protein
MKPTIGQLEDASCSPPSDNLRASLSEFSSTYFVYVYLLPLLLVALVGVETVVSVYTPKDAMRFERCGQWFNEFYPLNERKELYPLWNDNYTTIIVAATSDSTYYCQVWLSETEWFDGERHSSSGKNTDNLVSGRTDLINIFVSIFSLACLACLGSLLLLWRRVRFYQMLDFPSSPLVSSLGCFYVSK